jgi:hypothetical protein
MQQSMSEQNRQLGRQVATAGLGLLSRRRDAQDYVTEETTGRVPELTLALREREDVSRAIRLAVKSIQSSDSIISSDEDRQLGARHLNRIEHRARAPGEVCARYPHVRTVLDNEPDGHAVMGHYAGPCTV